MPMIRPPMPMPPGMQPRGPMQASVPQGVQQPLQAPRGFPQPGTPPGAPQGLPGAPMPPQPPSGPEGLQAGPAEPGELAGEMPEVEQMTPDEVLVALRAEVEYADDALQGREDNRLTSEDYFYGELPAPPDTEELRSSIVSTDVADAVEAIMAEIMPAFTGQPPVEFVPFSQEDEAKADRETRAVTYVAGACGAYMALSAAVQDALLMRAGVVKVYWEETVDAKYETHKGIGAEMLPNIMKPGDEVVGGDIGADGFSLTLRRYVKKSKPAIRAVPLNEFLISSDATSPDLSQVRFVAHRRAVSRHDLVRMGFDREVVAKLASTAGLINSDDERSLETGHPSTEAIRAVEAYYRLDEDGDGIAELRRIVSAGGEDGTDELMLDETWDDQPFCVGIGYLGLYTWDGVSIFDKLRSVQDTKTRLLRNLIDASERNVRQRIGVLERQVNMDDIMTSVMGGVVRMSAPGAVFPLPDVIVPPQLFQTLEYMDNVRKDKGGGAIDTAAQVMAIAGDTAHGIERMMSAAEQLQAMLAKNLAETMVKPLYSKLHALLRKYWEGEIKSRSGSSWQFEIPRKWSPREELVVSMGMSVGERGRRVAALQAVIANQNAALKMGMAGAAVSGPQLYAAQIDLARMAGLPGPEQYWIDPASPESMKAAQEKQQQAAQGAQKKDAITQQQLNVPIEMEKIKAQAKLQESQLRTQSDNALESMKLQAQTRMDLLEARIKMIELGAKFDGDPVPNPIPGTDPTAQPGSAPTEPPQQQAQNEATE